MNRMIGVAVAGLALLALAGCVTGDRKVDALVETGAWAAWRAAIW